MEALGGRSTGILIFRSEHGDLEGTSLSIISGPGHEADHWPWCLALRTEGCVLMWNNYHFSGNTETSLKDSETQGLFLLFLTTSLCLRDITILKVIGQFSGGRALQVMQGMLACSTQLP